MIGIPVAIVLDRQVVPAPFVHHFQFGQRKDEALLPSYDIDDFEIL